MVTYSVYKWFLIKNCRFFKKLPFFDGFVKIEKNGNWRDITFKIK